MKILFVSVFFGILAVPIFANFRDPAWTLVLKKTPLAWSRDLAQCIDGAWREPEVNRSWIWTPELGGRILIEYL